MILLIKPIGLAFPLQDLLLLCNKSQFSVKSEDILFTMTTRLTTLKSSSDYH